MALLYTTKEAFSVRMDQFYQMKRKGYKQQHYYINKLAILSITEASVKSLHVDFLVR